MRAQPDGRLSRSAKSNDGRGDAFGKDTMNIAKRSFTIKLNEILRELPPYPHKSWNGEALNDYAYARAIEEGFDVGVKIHISYYPRLRVVVVWQNAFEYEINLN